MAENGERPPLIAVQYDDQADIPHLHLHCCTATGRRRRGGR